MSDADTDAGPSHDADPVTAAEFREASRALSAGANKAFNSIFIPSTGFSLSDTGWYVTIIFLLLN